MEVAEAAKWADVMMMLTPDELQGDIWRDHIAKNINDGAAIMFAHGLNVHFQPDRAGQGHRRADGAPKGPGHTVRSEYQRGAGVPCLIAIHQDASGNATTWACPMLRRSAAAAPASSRPPSRKNAKPTCSASRLCCAAALVELMKAGYETLVEAGYAPEMAYFECVHEVKLIVDLIYEGGIANMNYSVSNTAEYGEYVSGPRVITAETKAEMKKVLADIQSGRFTRGLDAGEQGQSDLVQGNPGQARRAPDRAGRAAKLREMMPWIKQRALVDRPRTDAKN